MTNSTMRSLAGILFGVGGVALGGCGSDATTPVPPLDPPPNGTLTGSPEPAVRLGYSFFSGFQSPARIVVTDRNSLDAAWIEVNHNMMPIPATPDVDFTQDLVVVAALGPRTNGGERITIDSARAAGQDVDVFVSSRSPAPGCVATTVMTSPADIVSLPGPAGSVRFIEQALQVGC